MNNISDSLKQRIITMYNEGQEYKRKWSHLTVKKIADKWEVSIDTLKGVADGSIKPTGNTLIEESDIPIIKELLCDSYEYKREFDRRSPKAISKELGISLGVVRNIIRNQERFINQ